MTSAVSAIQAAAEKCFDAQRKSVTKQLQAALGKVAKGAKEDLEAEVQKVLDGLDLEGYEAFADIIRAEVEQMFADGAVEAAEQVGEPLVGVSLKLTNEQAVEYAKDRAAEMVGMKWVNGKLVPNPNAEWVIADGTREMLRTDVRDAMTGGWSNDELAAALQDNYAFSETRAEVVARTETAKADVQGNLAGYKATGIVSGKRWLTAPECCDDCQELDGEEVGIDEQFPNDGGDGPPLHPQCRCDVLPVLSGNEQEQD